MEEIKETSIQEVKHGKEIIIDCKFQRCPFNVGKPFFRWGYVILSQNKSDLVVF